MKEFYMFDGEDYVECAGAILEDLVRLCEDNEVMIKAIEKYFKVK